MVPGAGLEPACRIDPARDFKSLASTSFATQASAGIVAHGPCPIPIPPGCRCCQGGNDHQEATMKVSQVMTRDVVWAHPDQSICEAARTMQERDFGSLPVGTGD